MIERARKLAVSGSIDFELADVLDWRSSEPVDLVFSNACFHWIEDHRRLFDRLVPQLAEGGVLAFQVPANHTEPSHTILSELCSSGYRAMNMTSFSASSAQCCARPIPPAMG